MKREKKKNFKIGFMLILVLVIGFSGASMAADGLYGAKASVENRVYTLEEMLTYAIEDEYLAKAEYKEIMERFGEKRPFTNIIKAEDRHIQALTVLFEAQGLRLPKDTSNSHVIKVESLSDALKTGIQAEIDNIAMYETFLKQDLPQEVQRVFEQLKKASENHLKAFQRAEQGNGGNGFGKGGQGQGFGRRGR